MYLGSRIEVLREVYPSVYHHYKRNRVGCGGREISARIAPLKVYPWGADGPVLVPGIATSTYFS